MPWSRPLIQLGYRPCSACNVRHWEARAQDCKYQSGPTSASYLMTALGLTHSQVCIPWLLKNQRKPLLEDKVQMYWLGATVNSQERTEPSIMGPGWRVHRKTVPTCGSECKGLPLYQVRTIPLSWSSTMGDSTQSNAALGTKLNPYK
jgi:hypothetical protein